MATAYKAAPAKPKAAKVGRGLSDVVITPTRAGKAQPRGRISKGPFKPEAFKPVVVKVQDGEYVLHLGRIDETTAKWVSDGLRASFHKASLDSPADVSDDLAAATFAWLRDFEVQRLVDASQQSANKADAIQARMRAKAVELVMNGTNWLTATELFAELPKKPSNAHTVLARWLDQGRIFAMEKSGVRIYPRYAFDAMVEPVPMLKEVLKVLAGRSPFQIASWFESPSNYLDGKRPREVLETNGLAVVTAAQRLVEGAVHG